MIKIISVPSKPKFKIDELSAWSEALPSLHIVYKNNKRVDSFLKKSNAIKLAKLLSK